MTSRQPTTPTTGEDDVERVARALFENECLLNDDPVNWGRSTPEQPRGYKTEVMMWQSAARAALAAISPTTEDAEKRELVEALRKIADLRSSLFPNLNDERLRRARSIANAALASIGERS